MMRMVVLLIALGLAGCEDPCPDDYELEGDSCYRLVDTDQESWTAAERECERATYQGIPAHLAVIDSDGERDMLLRAYRGGSQGYWVGGSDRDVEGTFTWVTGEPMMREQDWAPGEPNNDFGTEDCMEYRVDITDMLNDRTCTHEMDFACEWDGVAPE